MSEFSIGDLSVKPGERAYGKLGTFYLSDGTAVSLPLMVVRGERDGPVLWISAGMHGQEMSGIPVIWDIIKKRVDPKTLRGTVVGAPLLNPFSFNGRTYYTPEDGYNVNRVFPGDPGGLLREEQGDGRRLRDNPHRDDPEARGAPDRDHVR